MVHTTSILRSSTSYCLNLVKKRDYEHYLSTLLLPKSPFGARRAVFAIRAFNAEVASVRDSVTERGLGEIRMQFWREVLEEVRQGDRVRRHPVVMELAAAVKTFNVN